VKVAAVCTGAVDDGGVLLCERHLNAAVLCLRPEAALLSLSVPAGGCCFVGEWVSGVLSEGVVVEGSGGRREWC
jgi:hypothetical protein